MRQSYVETIILDQEPSVAHRERRTRETVSRRSLLETRYLIDELDRDLVHLLARRAHLSRRAGSIKAIHGRAIRDPERERSLLDQRKVWAREEDLEPAPVVDIFAAILRFSRALQAKQP